MSKLALNNPFPCPVIPSNFSALFTLGTDSHPHRASNHPFSGRRSNPPGDRGRAQTRGAPRFARMVSFFEGVGTGETAGYGTTGKPQEPKGSRERYRKMREARAKATEAVGT